MMAVGAPAGVPELSGEGNALSSPAIPSPMAQLWRNARRVGSHWKIDFMARTLLFRNRGIGFGSRQETWGHRSLAENFFHSSINHLQLN
jgi:hypothetical protein